MSTEILYLVIAPGRWYRQIRIKRVTKRKPTVKIGEALVKLTIELPSGALNPPECTVQIKPEHIAQKPVTVISEQP